VRHNLTDWGFGAIEGESCHGIFDIGTKLSACVALRHNVFGQALGDVAAVFFLSHVKNKFAVMNCCHDPTSG